MQKFKNYDGHRPVEKPLNYRLPKLKRAIMSLCFSETEVLCAFHNWVYHRSQWGSEAQDHYGGFSAMVKQARQSHSFKIRKGMEL